MSWRDANPQPVQDDMDDLLDAALNLAEERLAQHGGFYPFSMAVDTSGGRKLLESATGDAQRAKELSFRSLKHCGPRSVLLRSLSMWRCRRPDPVGSKCISSTPTARRSVCSSLTRSPAVRSGPGRWRDTPHSM